MCVYNRITLACHMSQVRPCDLHAVLRKAGRPGKPQAGCQAEPSSPSGRVILNSHAKAKSSWLVLTGNPWENGNLKTIGKTQVKLTWLAGKYSINGGF